MRVIIGLDVGSKGIGVARVEANPAVWSTVGATAVGLVRRQGVKKDVLALGDLLVQHGLEAEAVVVGLPLTEDGEEQRSTRLARQVADAVAEAWTCPVHTQDETYSTLEAEQRLRSRGIGQRRWAELIDAEAAAVILEDWLRSANG